MWQLCSEFVTNCDRLWQTVSDFGKLYQTWRGMRKWKKMPLSTRFANGYVVSWLIILVTQKCVSSNDVTENRHKLKWPACGRRRRLTIAPSGRPTRWWPTWTCWRPTRRPTRMVPFSIWELELTSAVWTVCVGRWRVGRPDGYIAATRWSFSTLSGKQTNSRKTKSLK